MGSLTSAESGIHSPVAEAFSLTHGGLFYRLQAALHMTREERAWVALRALAAIVLTWLPLLLLSAAQGLAIGNRVRIPFLLDIAANVRFLIALPLLIVSEVGIDRRLREVVVHFVKSGLVPERELPAFESVIERVVQLRDRVLPELVLLALALVPSISVRGREFLVGNVSTWQATPFDGGRILSYAGWWFCLVSAPLFRFLVLRWLWTMALWGGLLWRVSRLNLRLIPTHADRTAGLGFLAEGQLKFSSIVFAGSTVMAAQAANALAYRGATIGGLKYILLGYCVVGVAVLMAPLLVVIPTLVRVKKRGLFEYATLATAYSRKFHAKWVHTLHPPQEELLGSADIQSLSDINGSYAIVRDMRVVPIDKATLAGLAVAALLPMVPLILMVTSAEELLKDVMHLLL